MSSSRLRFTYIFVLSCCFCLAIVVAHPVAANPFLLHGTVGPSSISGEVGDWLIEDGINLGGGGYLGLSEQMFIGAGLHISVHDAESPADSGFGFMFEGSGRFYFMTREQSKVRPYVAGSLGLGLLEWNYESAYEDYFGTEADGVAFFYFAPEVGIDLSINDRFSFEIGGRYVSASYDDETFEDLIWDLDGGNYTHFYVGMAVWVGK